MMGRKVLAALAGLVGALLCSLGAPSAIRPAERVREGEQTGELDAIARVIRELSTTLDLGRIFDVICDEAMRETDAHYVDVVLVDKEKRTYTVKALKGYPPEVADRLKAVQYRIYEGVRGEAIRTGEPVLVPEMAGDEGLWMPDIRSLLAVPIFYEEAVVGVLSLGSRRPNAFDEKHLRFAQVLSMTASVAIGNALRYEQQVRATETAYQRAEQLAALAELGRSFRSDRPLEAILEDVAYAIQEHVGFNVVLISVVEGEPPYLRRIAAAGLPIAVFEEMKKVRQPLERITNILTEEYRMGRCYFFPHQKKEKWAKGLHIYNPMKEPEKPLPEGHWHPDDMLLVPFYGSSGEILGIISVDDPYDGLLPSRSTLDALETFAAQAAVAIENNRLLEATQTHLHELIALVQASESLNKSLSPEEVLDIILDTALFLVGRRRGVIVLVEHPAGVLKAASSRGISPDVVREFNSRALPASTEPFGHIISTGEVFEAREVKADVKDILPFPEGMTGIPLRAERGVLGILLLDRVEDPQMRRLVMALTDMAAVALERAFLFAELEKRVEERTAELRKALQELRVERDRVEALYRISRQLVTTLDVDRVLTNALELVKEAVGAPQGAIMLLDPETNRLIYRAALGRAKPLPKGGKLTPFRPGYGLAGWVMEHRQPVIVEDVTTDERWVHLKPEAERVRKAALAVPLSLGTDVLGVMILFHPQPGYFNEDHLKLVSAAASQVVQALNNAQLYKLITEQAEKLGEMLREQAAEAVRNQAILTSIADGILVLDSDDRVVLINPAAEEILGLSGRDVVGEHIRQVLSWGATEESRELGRALCEEFFQRKGEVRPEGPSINYRAEGGRRVVDVTLSPVMVEAGEPPGVVAVLRDVTREVEVERMKTEFISIVSHELRTPMTSIKGYTDLLYMGVVGELNEQQKKFLNVIKNNADRLAALVNDILDIARIESGRIRLKLEPLSLREVVDEVVEAFQYKFQMKHLSLNVDVPPDLPSIRADRDRLNQILTNLVENAYQYTLPGGRVTISAHINAGKVQVDVQDTGIGISPEDLPRVFDRFFRADHPVVRNSPGTGLGLSIVKAFVEMQGGEVWVESELGRGSTFSFTLPLASDSET